MSEPTDAQVEAAARRLFGATVDSMDRARDLARVALRAAGAVAEEPEWEYRYAEIGDDGTMWTYSKAPDDEYDTFAAAYDARVDETDVVVRRVKAGPWVWSHD